MKRLAILGASGHGAVVADAALAAGWQTVTFFDDAFPRLRDLGPWRVEGTTATLLDAGCDAAVVAIGDNATRLRKQRSLTAAGVTLASIVHPAAVVSPLAEIGAGCVVFAGSVINPFARLGDACIVNTAASIDHHCVLMDGVHVSPGAHLGGGVRVGTGSWIGIGAAVRPLISIGAHVVVGAGAAVVADVSDGATVVGVPARRRPDRGC